GSPACRRHKVAVACSPKFLPVAAEGRDETRTVCTMPLANAPRPVCTFCADAQRRRPQAHRDGLRLKIVDIHPHFGLSSAIAHVPPGNFMPCIVPPGSPPCDGPSPSRLGQLSAWLLRRSPR